MEKVLERADTAGKKANEKGSMENTDIKYDNESLDPVNWEEMKELGHKMVDDMIDYLKDLKNQPVWRAPGEEMKNSFKRPLPVEPGDPQEIYKEFLKYVLPYNKGNVHPRFWGWVEGNGTVLGMLADMLASGMNPNLGVADHGAIYVEMQVITWLKEMLGFEPSASGLIVSGGSAANLIGIAVGRNGIEDIKTAGSNSKSKTPVIYCSSETHMSVQKAVEVLGIGTDNMRIISVDNNFKINLDELREKIKEDKEKGFTPFCIVGNVGTVNTGAIDPIEELYKISREENLWLHLDAAFGAFTALHDEYKDKIKGMQLADSVAFDLHKWMYVNYEAGCVIVRDEARHKKSFEVPASYLVKMDRGLAGAPITYSNYGLQLSRGFRSLKVWMSLKEHGRDKYARMISKNISQARYLESLVKENQKLEVLAPVEMNIVAFRYTDKSKTDAELNEINKEILITLQTEGIASPTNTVIKGKFAIRVSVTNHRSTKEDFDTLVKETIRIGENLSLK